MSISVSLDSNDMGLLKSEDIDEGSESPYRNLWASLLASAIHDLERYKIIATLPYSNRPNAMANYIFTCMWLNGADDCAVTFDACLENLDLNKVAFITALVNQKLLPKEVMKIEGVELVIDISEKTLPPLYSMGALPRNVRDLWKSNTSAPFRTASLASRLVSSRTLRTQLQEKNLEVPLEQIQI
jgi:hypothetical protein